MCCSVARSLEVLYYIITLIAYLLLITYYSYIIALLTGGANDAQNVSVDTAHGKDNDQQNLYKKNDNVILQGI